MKLDLERTGRTADETDLGMPAPAVPEARGLPLGGRCARIALALLAALVGVAVYAPGVAGDRPLLVRTAWTGLLDRQRKRLDRIHPYDLRGNTPGVEAQVRRTLETLRTLTASSPDEGPGFADLLGEWDALSRPPFDRERQIAFLAGVSEAVKACRPARLTWFPALAERSGFERMLFALFPVGLAGLLWWLLGARRRWLIPGGILTASLTLAITWLAFGSRPGPLAAVDFKKEIPNIRAEDPQALVILPPIPYHPDRPDGRARLEPPLSRTDPDARHWLGTDDLGRDVASLLVWGTRTSLLVGLMSAALLLTIGIALGAAAGYLRGPVDLLISRLIEVVQAFPALILILMAVAFLESGVWVVILVIGCTRWTTAARLVRGEFLRLREAEFVAAARGLGLPATRVVVRHVLPNALGPVLVHGVFAVAAAILVESGLAFLGLGDRNLISWGQVIDRGRDFVSAWWITVFPGACLFLTILALRALGEGIRFASAPRTGP
jgi:peptide/nickel transport system permease protein